MSKAIIFDFDGTLVDSEITIYKCFQTITNYLAPERIDYAKNILIGPPLRDTASEILGPNHQEQLDEFVRLFIEMHDEKAIKHTKSYPDVANVLLTLYKNNVLMAIATNKRNEYAKKVHSLLNTNGKLVGLMFNAPMYSDHPPFGGSVKEYKTYFSTLFNYKYFEPAYNSISSRNGKELFVNLIKK